MSRKEQAIAKASLFLGVAGLAVGAISLIQTAQAGKAQRTLTAVPPAARPGEKWLLYVKGFIPPQLTVVVQGYLGRLDNVFTVNTRRDGSTEISFTVEQNRPPGEYWVTVFDESDMGLALTFKVI